MSEPVRLQPPAANHPVSQGGSTDNPVPVRGVLDAGAIGRLRELDPSGASQLLSRVLNAFETSLNRLLPQLVQARDGSDAAGVRLVAHTLKSSSATVGALELSRLCAEVEALARQLRLEEAVGGIEQMLLEAEAVRTTLRELCRDADSRPGAA